MTDAPFRFRWTARHGWREGFFDAYLAKWKVAQITPGVNMGGQVDAACCWDLRIVCHWRPSLTGPYRGVADTPREAARMAEAAFPGVVTTHPTFFMRIEEEDLFRAVLGLPMPEVGRARLEDSHLRYVRESFLSSSAA